MNRRLALALSIPLFGLVPTGAAEAQVTSAPSSRPAAEAAFRKAHDLAKASASSEADLVFRATGPNVVVTGEWKVESAPGGTFRIEGSLVPPETKEPIRMSVVGDGTDVWVWHTGPGGLSLVFRGDASDLTSLATQVNGLVLLLPPALQLDALAQGVEFERIEPSPNGPVAVGRVRDARGLLAKTDEAKLTVDAATGRMLALELVSSTYSTSMVSRIASSRPLAQVPAERFRFSPPEGSKVVDLRKPASRPAGG